MTDTSSESSSSSISEPESHTVSVSYPPPVTNGISEVELSEKKTETDVENQKPATEERKCIRSRSTNLD